MIRIKASAVITVLDDYTGAAVAPSLPRVFLDGAPCRPQGKEGGHLIFINLEPGAHEIILKSAYHLAETLMIEVADGRMTERIVRLRPAANYPFGANAAHARVTVRAEGKILPRTTVRFAAAGGANARIAQDALKAGETAVKLFIGGRYQPPLPLEFLLAEGEKAELNVLTALRDGTGILEKPARHDYKRGAALYPCLAYETDEEGVFTASARQPDRGLVFAGERLYEFALAAGANDIVIDI